MHRTSRNNAICFKNLEQAISEHPQTYRHIDLLCAGWPCQGNSIAGNRQGFRHKQSGLWQEVARCLRLFKPKWFLGENVPGLLSVNEGQDFQEVTTDLQEIGYGISWNVFDSQWFGVAQRRKRVFIVGYFGDICPPEILFEPKGSRRNDKKVKKVGQRGLCLSTRDGERQDPTNEALIAFKTGAITAKSYGDKGWAPSNEWNTILASTLGTSKNPDPNYGTHFIAERVKKGIHSAVRTQEPGNRIQGFVAQTLGATPRGNVSFIWQDTHIAETNPDRKRETSRTSHKLDSVRGVVIGNAVTVNVAKQIAKRIYDYEMGRLL